MHVVADKKSEMIEVKSEDIAENMSKEKFEYYDNNKIKKAKISDNATFIYNGKKLDVVSDADLQADNGYVRLISNNGGSTYDTVIMKHLLLIKLLRQTAFYILNMIKVHLI